MMVKLELIRKKYTNKQTIGILNVYKNNVFVCSFASLELCWNNNESLNSCILPGNYKVSKWNSNKHPNSFILEKTEPRTSILIHSGNYYNHTEGCILIGYIHKDINFDGYQDVINSNDSMNMLNEICKDEKVISIQII